MNAVALSLIGLIAATAAQVERDPPVIAKMEDLGTLYVTRQPVKTKKGAAKSLFQKTRIIGIDFRPRSGADPKKIVEAVGELETLPHLQSVLFLGMGFTDEAAQALPTGGKLNRVQFFNTSITDKGVAKLTRLKGLSVFKFTGRGLTDAGMRELARIKTLATIEITDAMKVTDEGVLALCKMPNLIRLTVENTSATQEAIDRLRQQLPQLDSGERFLR